MNEPLTLDALNEKIELVAYAGSLSAQGAMILVKEAEKDQKRIDALEAEVAELRATKKFLGEAVHLLLAREFGPEYRETSGLFD